MTEPDPARPMLLRNATWADAEDSGPLTRNGDIRIEGGHITALGALEPGTGETVLDCGGAIVMPGLFDAVTDTALRSCAGCLDTPDPVAALARLDAARLALDPAQEGARTATAAAEMLAAGTTECVDLLRGGPVLAERLAARKSGWAASGLRADLAVELTAEADPALMAAVFSDPDETVPLHAAVAFPGPDDVPTVLARLKACGALARDLYLLPPTTPPLDPEGMLTAALALARAPGRAGAQTVACGLPLVTVEAAERAAEAGLVLAIIPETDALLARRRADGKVLAEAGVDVRLGSGAVSNGATTMQTVMRVATMLDRPAQQRVDDWLTNRAVLEFATKDRRGRPRAIVPGAPADLALYDRGAAVWTPLNNLDDQIVSSETGTSVMLTIVAGRILWRRDPAPLAQAV